MDSKLASTLGASGKTLSLHDGVPFENPTLYLSIVDALQYVTYQARHLLCCQQGFWHKPAMSIGWLWNESYATWKAPLRLAFTSNSPLLWHSKHILMKIGLPTLMTGRALMDIASSSNQTSFPTLQINEGLSPGVAPNLNTGASPQSPLSLSRFSPSWRNFAYQLLHSLIWCDNQSATHLANNPVFHARSKHIDLDLHFVRERVLSKDLSIHYIMSSNQIVDIFTKYLPSSQFINFRTKLSIIAKPMSLRGSSSTRNCSWRTFKNPRLKLQESYKTASLLLVKDRSTVIELGDQLKHSWS